LLQHRTWHFQPQLQLGSVTLLTVIDSTQREFLCATAVAVSAAIEDAVIPLRGKFDANDNKVDTDDNKYSCATTQAQAKMVWKSIIKSS
jgi:hypothetical protein